eukprot:261046-Rhodomonas_salina.2
MEKRSVCLSQVRARRPHRVACVTLSRAKRAKPSQCTASYADSRQHTAHSTWACTSQRSAPT